MPHPGRLRSKRPRDVGAQSGAPRRTAVICSAQHWHAAVHLSAHHLAKFLADRGWTVCFVSTPTSLLHRIRFADDADSRARFDDWRRGGGWDGERRIYHYTPLAILPPSRMAGLSSPWLLRNWARLTWPPLVPHLARQGFGTPDLLIADSALMLHLHAALGRPRLVYRVTDRNRNYPNRPPGLDALERELAGAAALVVHTAEGLGDYAGGLGPARTLCIPNGVEVEHFARPAPPPPEYARIPAPRAVFVGTIAEWFDAGLVRQAAAALGEVSFVIVGPGGATLSNEALPANVHVLGARPYAQIPGYLQHAAVGLIPFTRTGHEAFVDAINPLKLYEYMAAGLPVVATPFRAIVDLASPAIIAADRAEFTSAIGAVVARTRDGRAEREFACQRDWSRQFAPLADELGL